MVFTKRRAFPSLGGGAQFLIAMATLLVLAAPAIGQTFTNGQYCTYTQGGWGAVPHGNNPAMLLSDNFSSIYPAGVAVGDKYKMTFTGSLGIQNYLQAGGKPKALMSSYTDPTSTSSGVFGGQVLTLQLNVDFSDAGVTPTGFGDLQLVGAPFGAQTVRDLLLVANQMLGDDFTTFDTTLNDLVSLLNQGFDNCYPSGWAQDDLSPPTSACPPGQFEC